MHVNNNSYIALRDFTNKILSKNFVSFVTGEKISYNLSCINLRMYVPNFGDVLKTIKFKISMHFNKRSLETFGYKY